MRYFLLLSLMIISLLGWSQQQSAVNRASWNKLKEVSKTYSSTGRISESEIAPFPVYKINGDWYVSLYGMRVDNPNWSVLDQNNVLKGSSVGKITTIKVPLKKIYSIDLSEFYAYLEIPAKANPLLDRAVKDVHADSVQKGINLPAAFTGKDVYIGVTDWGFDYSHPMFYDTLLTTSRVAAAWDQYKLSGPAPAGFSYGAEYDTPAELVAAETDTSNIYSHHTHGNHVAGIAGGSGAGTEYRGFAFESEFLFATFLIDAASVIDAFVWMKDKAEADGKRLVINMSWGLYYMGTLDGNSILSQALNQLSTENNVVFVASAGNNGGVNFHIRRQFNNDSFSSTVNFYDYAANPNMWGQSITMWGEENLSFDAKISVHTSTGTLLVSSPMYSTAATSAYVDSILVTGSDTIFFNLAAEDVNPLNNRPNMRLRIKNTNTALKIVLTSGAESGVVHYWNLVELTNGVGNWGMPFVSFGITGLSGDAKYSIGEPTCSSDAISVAAHSSTYINPQGNPAGGARASFSSIGPLYNETMKPDISAPGVSVASSISSYTDATYTATATINFNGTDYDFAKFSGTSMSSPCVAGVVALILDANPTLSPAQVKEIIKSTARLDNYTGVITAPGDYSWGMGKVNAYQAVILALNTVSLEELQSNNWITIYPNPWNGTVYVLAPESSNLGDVTFVAMDGKRTNFANPNGMIDISSLSNGIYIVEGILDGKPVSTRFVKN